jgi:hypothetical protein
MLPMSRFTSFLIGIVQHSRRGALQKFLVGGYIFLFGGTMLVFIAPSLFARRLITPLWALSIFVVLGTFSYAGIYIFSMLRRWLRALRKDRPSGTN